MNASARWQEIIAENLASTSIPGFKRQDMSFQAVAAGVENQDSLPSHLRFSLIEGKELTSFKPGELRSTGGATDVAIQGEGFFGVQLPSGATGYTRDGEFHISAEGNLVTKQGYAVLGDSGTIQLDRSNPGPITISATGEISQGATRIGKLQISSFSQPELLKSTGGVFTATDPAVRPTDMPQPSLRQGFLETANTSAVTEMANLITSMRAFESNQRVLQIHDESAGRAIVQLSSPQ